MVIIGRHFICEKSQRESQEYLKNENNFVMKILIQPGLKEDDDDLISKALKQQPYFINNTKGKSMENIVQDYSFDLYKNKDGSQTDARYDENQIHFEQCNANVLQGEMEHDKISGSFRKLSEDINDINVNKIVTINPESSGIFQNSDVPSYENVSNDQRKDDLGEPFTNVSNFKDVTSEGKALIECDFAEGVEDSKNCSTSADKLTKEDNGRKVTDFPNAHHNNCNSQDGIVIDDTSDSSSLINSQTNNVQLNTDINIKTFKDRPETSKILSTKDISLKYKVTRKSKVLKRRANTIQNQTHIHTTTEAIKLDNEASLNCAISLNGTDSERNHILDYGSCSKISYAQIHMDSEIHKSHGKPNSSRKRKIAGKNTRTVRDRNNSPTIIQSIESNSVHKVISTAYTKLIDVFNQKVNSTETGSRSSDSAKESEVNKSNCIITKNLEDKLNTAEMDDAPLSVRMKNCQTKHFVHDSQDKKVDNANLIETSTTILGKFLFSSLFFTI